MEKIRYLGKDLRDSGRAVQSITSNSGKEPIILDDVDTLADDELSSISSPSLNLSPTKNAWENAKAKSVRSLSHHPTFSDAVSGASRRASRETSRRQNQPVQALRNASVLPEGIMPPVLPVGMMPQMSFVHLAFGTGPTFYMPPAALICRIDDMLYFGPRATHP